MNSPGVMSGSLIERALSPVLKGKGHCTIGIYGVPRPISANGARLYICKQIVIGIVMGDSNVVTADSVEFRIKKMFHFTRGRQAPVIKTAIVKIGSPSVSCVPVHKAVGIVAGGIGIVGVSKPGNVEVTIVNQPSATVI